MSRVITVKGTGVISRPPDTIVLTMDLDSRHAEYAKCMKLAGKEIDELRHALMKINFAADMLETIDFRIETEYKQYKDTFGNSHDIFDVWRCRHELKLEFSLDFERLYEVLSVISKCSTPPNFKVRFSISDSDGIYEELLRNATESSWRKAEILCAASGVTLGEIVNIDYNWGELSLYSRTTFEDDYAEVRVCCNATAPVRFAPEEIKNSDTVTFVWSII